MMQLRMKADPSVSRLGPLLNQNVTTTARGPIARENSSDGEPNPNANLPSVEEPDVWVYRTSGSATISEAVTWADIEMLIETDLVTRDELEVKHPHSADFLSYADAVASRATKSNPVKSAAVVNNGKQPWRAQSNAVPKASPPLRHAEGPSQAVPRQYHNTSTKEWDRDVMMRQQPVGAFTAPATAKPDAEAPIEVPRKNGGAPSPLLPPDPLLPMTMEDELLSPPRRMVLSEPQPQRAQPQPPPLKPTRRPDAPRMEAPPVDSMPLPAPLDAPLPVPTNDLVQLTVNATAPPAMPISVPVQAPTSPPRAPGTPGVVAVSGGTVPPAALPAAVVQKKPAASAWGKKPSEPAPQVNILDLINEEERREREAADRRKIELAAITSLQPALPAVPVEALDLEAEIIRLQKLEQAKKAAAAAAVQPSAEVGGEEEEEDGEHKQQHQGRRRGQRGRGHAEQPTNQKAPAPTGNAHVQEVQHNPSTTRPGNNSGDEAAGSKDSGKRRGNRRSNRQPHEEQQAHPQQQQQQQQQARQPRRDPLADYPTLGEQFGPAKGSGKSEKALAPSPFLSVVVGGRQPPAEEPSKKKRQMF